MTSRNHSTQSEMSHVNRRKFLQTSGTVGAALALTTTASTANASTAHAQSSLSSRPEPHMVEPTLGERPFLHGVASGDPIPDSVVLWTRVTPDADAMPGSGAGAPTTVEWEIARDEEFRDIVKHGEVTTDPAQDHTVHVDPHGLEPESVYYFRFHAQDKISPVGRTKTAPAVTASPEELTFGVASCANWESGFFQAYGDIAKRGRAGQLDYMVFLGDYIYEYPQREYAGFGPVRLHHPAHEITTLEDYRTRLGRYRTDENLQAAHAALPWIAVWDDHETADNSWRDGAHNHTEGKEGAWIDRRNAAMQAYFEWMPVRASNPSNDGHLYRCLTFGDLVELTMMDLRTYRDKQILFGPARMASEGRSMLGSEQYDWLVNKIDTSAAAWNMLGNSVMFSPMNLATLQRDDKLAPVSSSLSSNITGIPVNGDQWDGYSAERRMLIDALAKHDSHALFVTGDIHSEWAHNISKDGHIFGAEMVCSSVSAPNVNEQLHLPEDNELSKLAERFLLEANPHTRHVNLDHHGYSYVTIRPDSAEMHWLRVEDLLNPAAPVNEAVTLTWRPDQGFNS
ncbi:MULTISPECIES: alkaline phosphatase D family protein [unclassified Corynebacterium]|uniref:alkaline phosphatase D family protein n=1 Tax=Corynebacterium TaxID=1716 RepID=UPI00254AFB14|nr:MULTISPECIES: alkaline phosphatase D family protein [unclassified Corynebacterium]MDK8466995.1 alkaline phosphatase D family protein [Corynebacterium sp. MSK130]MDK8687517.1 alkaline phosphatase D family protein [Corynebacterium sp. MSK122]MDK8702138.1 alkaline phosphatase D family protein [Corynebacterium sp. MSK107]MDK8704358.1 alkaline phosphatase D family protein [Corynebacterium sp. MSK090]MDK8831248.1 alkaline phosphatase D family protein [Corynebacterium sp. MSK072]